MTGRTPLAWSYGYEDLMRLTAMDQNTVQQAASRGRRKIASGFDPESFESVVRWVFRNATDEFKIGLMTEMNFFRTPQGQAHKRRARK